MQNIGVEPFLVDPLELDENYLHVVAAIIWKREDPRKFLIARRQADKHLAHYWELPGGKVEAGESPQEALNRELAEEIAINTVSSTQYMQVYHRYAERNVLLDTWIVDLYEGEVIAREQQELVWINLDQIDEYLFPDADLPILDGLKKRQALLT